MVEGCQLDAVAECLRSRLRAAETRADRRDRGGPLSRRRPAPWSPLSQPDPLTDCHWMSVSSLSLARSCSCVPMHMPTLRLEQGIWRLFRWSEPPLAFGMP